MPYVSRRPFTWSVAMVQDATAILGVNDANKTSSSATYVCLKELTLAKEVYPNGTLTVEFEGTCAAGGTAYAKVYVNDVAVGTEREPNNVGWTNYSENFTFTTLHVGDRIQVYGKKGTAPSVTIRNFRVLGIEYAFFASVT